MSLFPSRSRSPSRFLLFRSTPGITLTAAILLLLSIAPVAEAQIVQSVAGGFVSGADPFPVSGFNCYYLMVYAAEPGLRQHVAEVLDDAKRLGATVIRTWAFNDGDGWNALQTSPGVYAERVFIGLDYVIREAGRRGLKVLLTLVNNWDDYGGMGQYVEWSPSAASHDDFYTDPQARDWYRAHAARVLGRVNTLSGIAYRDDPAIFGWELANEPRARTAGAAVLDAWIGEMSAHLKTLDPEHMISTGSEGFYGGTHASRNPASWMAAEGVDYVANHSHASIDFASFHAYPDHWGLSIDAGVRWVRDHFSDAREVLGKPALLGEIGKREPLSLRNDFFSAAYDAAAAAQRPGLSTAGILPWILYHDEYPDYDGFGIYWPDPDHAVTTGIIESGGEAIRTAILGGPAFVRGDANCDAIVDISDPVRILAALFGGAGSLCCERAADADGDGALAIADPIHALAHLFTEGAAPPAPYPACGREPGAALGCAGPTSCP